MAKATPPTIFVSYSHKDQDWLDYLKSHLGPALRAGSLDLWDDTRLRGGDDWEAEIEAAMRACRVCILLVSRYSLTSDYIDRVEMKTILERVAKEGIRIYPVFVSPVHVPKAHWLRKYNWRPRDGRPLKQIADDNGDRDSAAVSIVDELVDVSQIDFNIALGKDDIKSSFVEDIARDRMFIVGMILAIIPLLFRITWKGFGCTPSGVMIVVLSVCAIFSREGGESSAREDLPDLFLDSFLASLQSCVVSGYEAYPPEKDALVQIFEQLFKYGELNILGIENKIRSAISGSSHDYFLRETSGLSVGGIEDLSRISVEKFDSELEFIRENSMKLSIQPLWNTGQVDAIEHWQREMFESLRTRGEEWEGWLNWYQGILFFRERVMWPDLSILLSILERRQDELGAAQILDLNRRLFA